MYVHRKGAVRSSAASPEEQLRECAAVKTERMLRKMEIELIYTCHRDLGSLVILFLPLSLNSEDS